MTTALIAVAAMVFMAAIYAVIVRGSLGLLKKRLEEDPELSRAIPNDQLDNDELVIDIEY